MSSAAMSVSETPVLRPLRVSVNASAGVIGNIAYSACQAGLLIVLARLGSAALVGQYALGLALTGPIMLLASLQLRSVQATDAAGSNHFSEYLALRLATSAAALLLIAVGSIILTDTTAAALVIVLVGVLKNSDALSDGTADSCSSRNAWSALQFLCCCAGCCRWFPLLALAAGLSLAAALLVAIAAGLRCGGSGMRSVRPGCASHSKQEQTVRRCTALQPHAPAGPGADSAAAGARRHAALSQLVRATVRAQATGQ
jgi:hypothetical protein